MGFWIFMSLFNLLIPVIMLAIGWLMKKHPPKDINGIVGYRTRKSKSSQQAWDFAQQFCGSIWIKGSIPLFIIALITDALTYGRTMDTIANVGFILEMLQCLVIILTIIPVERELKKKF